MMINLGFCSVHRYFDFLEIIFDFRAFQKINRNYEWTDKFCRTRKTIDCGYY